MAVHDGPGEVDEQWTLETHAYGRSAWSVRLEPGIGGDADWKQLKESFQSEFTDNRPIQRVLDLVRAEGCRTIVIERDYVDADYRSEYSAFWSGRFLERGSRSERWHFFASAFTARDLPELPVDPQYLGYAVIRPTELGLLGRTVITPPRGLVNARLAWVVERPNLFGNSLYVKGVPFYQQDGEFLRCAHAAAWICHYVAQNRGIVARRLTAEIAAMPALNGSKHRAHPSIGLTAEQLQGVFSGFGMPAFFLSIKDLPPLPAPYPPPKIRRFLNKPSVPAIRRHDQREADERIFRVVCKYLHSGLPITVLSRSADGFHAFTLVGWFPGEDGPTLVACDDQVGPYELIDSPSDPNRGAHRGEWEALMIPLPRRVFLTGEGAESRARHIVRTEASQADDASESAANDFAAIAPHLDSLYGEICVRSRLIEGRRYKVVADRQGRDPQAVRVIRMAQLPRYVWVVEFQDQTARRANDEAIVIAEIVFDSTSHDEAPVPLLFVTGQAAIDLNAADEDDDLDSPEPPIWLADTDGRRWRSMISDLRLNDREYVGEELSSASILATAEPEPDDPSYPR